MRRQRRRDDGEHQHAEGAADPRSDRGDAERGAGAALLRHGVAVDAGHHRGRFARDAHQDRGGGAAILRAVIDAGEHDDGLRGVEPEGHRQQDRNAGERADAGQHADQRADQAAEKGVPDIARHARRPKSRDRDCAGWFPRVILKSERPGFERRLERVDEQHVGEHRRGRCCRRRRGSSRRRSMTTSSAKISSTSVVRKPSHS